ncbi:MAG: hypothetical protein TEF_13330 [Rhizobiales bacterium NRL2]|nr:MAG: hypothetical protein TEF_13330 [Rhizobiales bacterium NRL2]
MRGMQAQARRGDQGPNTAGPEGEGELSSLVQALESQLEQARARIVRLEQLAETDELLAIANRRAFQRALMRCVAAAERHGDRACLVSLDVNGMKLINDNWGHPAGDAALKTVARVLTEDTRATDVVARMGGDEFAMILTQVDEAAAEAKCRSLVEKVRRTGFEAAGETIPIDLAFGVAEVTPGASADALMEEADRRMYRMKALSRNPSRGRP